MDFGLETLGSEVERLREKEWRLSMFEGLVSSFIMMLIVEEAEETELALTTDSFCFKRLHINYKIKTHTLSLYHVSSVLDQHFSFSSKNCLFQTPALVLLQS